MESFALLMEALKRVKEQPETLEQYERHFTA